MNYMCTTPVRTTLYELLFLFSSDRVVFYFYKSENVNLYTSFFYYHIDFGVSTAHLNFQRANRDVKN